MEEKKECYLSQQDDECSNIWSCTNCKFDFFWGESPEDIKNSELNYCPKCGKKIKEFVFIENEEED